MSTDIVVERASMAIDSDSPVHANRAGRTSVFFLSDEGNPTGGSSGGNGYSINWQNGVQEPNGAILEDILASCLDRLHFFQGDLPEQGSERGKFACRENSLAITHIEEALHWLNHRTLERRRRGVEGSYAR